MIADERGNFLEAGDLVFAAFNGQKAAGSWYRYVPEDTGVPEFFNRNGVAGDEFLVRDPVRGGEISSGFGNRIHPITGDMLLHAGVDFRAPTGTPIRAAGSGLITDMKYGDGYGWFIRIQHERGFETVYAHMSAFAEGLTPGRTVMRGDTIGYVGSTGSSTGAHLHYEVLRNGALCEPDDAGTADRSRSLPQRVRLRSLQRAARRDRHTARRQIRTSPPPAKC